MLSSVSSASSELYCRECGVAHPMQATHCFACGIAFSTAPVGTVTRPFIGLLTPGVLLQQRYQILEVLGQGATKATYKAKDTRLSNRLVLIKEIDQQDENAQDASTALDAHRREALLLTGLVHPNLPRVYDFFLEGGRGYFVMDFLVGETLEAYLNKSIDGCLPADARKRPMSLRVVNQELQYIATQEDETSSQSSLRPIVTYTGHSGPINNLAWSPDGQYIASAGQDITVQLWHSLTGDHIFTYKEHTQDGAHGIMSVNWSPNGKYIASGGYNGTARIWNAR